MADDESAMSHLGAAGAGSPGGDRDDTAMDGGEVQIDSSDEYDPARDISFPGLPEVPSTSASRPTSKHDSDFTIQRHPSSTSIGTNGQLTPMAAPDDPSAAAENTKQFDATAPDPNSASDGARLPHDLIGILEDRIAEDERGDLEGWLSLINEHKKRGQIEEIRKVYERFFEVFPHAAEQWIAFAKAEGELGTKAGVEAIFNKTLKGLPHLALWCTYLDHIRRYYNISLDRSGTTASQTNHAAYEAVLDAVGIDKESGALWQDYIQFIKSGPGIVGQNDWQAQSKMDLLRKAYQRAICVPTQAVEAIWKEYSGFEMGLNKTTGRKFLQEKSPDYMSARSSYTELSNLTRDVKRSTLPVLPPALGFAGDIEYMRQVDLWKQWVQWEKNDPLVLKEESKSSYKIRVLYVYQQSLMALRFWPEMWFDAAEFCFNNELESEGNDFLAQGIQANPESCLLAFKRADRIEMLTANGHDDASKMQRGHEVREPYDQVLDALYGLIAKAMEREEHEVRRIEAKAIEEAGRLTNSLSKYGSAASKDDDDNDDEEEAKKQVENRKRAQIVAVKAANSAQIAILNRTISHAWIALMRAMQRLQGKGKPNPRPGEIGGSRQVFTNARQKGRITSDVWIAAALLEFHNSDSEAAKKIFERGMRLFPEDEKFCIEYMKLLLNANDHTNARAVFETTVTRLLQKPESVAKARPLFECFHQYESQYGELAQVVKLESRMREAFPDDPKISTFSHRFAHAAFDPTAIRPLVSPATQARPKVAPSAEKPPSRQPTPPAIKVTSSMDSPKRPPPLDEQEAEAARPRKLARGESPLAGAAGRRLKQSRQPFDGTPLAGLGAMVPALPPSPLPRDLSFLLSIIPSARAYHAMRFKADEIVRILRERPLPTSAGASSGAQVGSIIAQSYGPTWTRP